MADWGRGWCHALSRLRALRT